MKALGDYTRPDPKKRKEILMKFSNRMSSDDIKTDLASWNLEFSKELQNIQGRLLPPETILGGNKASSFTYKSENADWGSCFRKWASTSSKNLTKWVVIHAARDEGIAKEFVANLMKVTPSLGMTFAKPRMESLVDNKPNTYLTCLDKMIEMKPQMVMVVVPNNKGNLFPHDN